MEKSGMTRRIDALGRIVIPKEIRHNLKIRNCDELEVKILDDGIFLSKYENLTKDRVISLLLSIIHKETNKNVILTSKNQIIDCIVNKEYRNLVLNDDVYNLIDQRNSISSLKKKIALFQKEELLSYIIHPIIVNGDLLGSIILFSAQDISLIDRIIMQFVQRFLSFYLE